MNVGCTMEDKVGPEEPLPVFFHLCETKHIIALVTEMIHRLIAHNDTYPFTIG